MPVPAHYPDTLARELATTRKVLDAFPPDQADFRPHPRSNSARQLAWTFVVEARLAKFALLGEPVVGKGFVPPPDSWEGIREAFDETYAEVTELARSRAGGAGGAGASDTVQFFVAPKQMGDYPLAEFLWFMLHDHIHHRGQLTVYLRMAGGKVPSIYGPSADEPWR